MFDYILAVLSSEIKNPHQVRILFSILAFISTLALVMAFYLLVNGLISPYSRRIKALNGEQDDLPVTAPEKSHNTLILALSKIIPNTEADRDNTQRKLVMAGFEKKESLSLYYSAKIITAFSLLLIGILIAQFRPEIEPKQTFLLVIALFLLGFMLPNIVLNKLILRRQKLIRNGFPDALDLLVVCVESGLSLTSAFQRVSENMEVSSPELGEVMARVNMEIRAGISRQEAFKNLAKRTGLDEVKGLITNLEQSIRFGTSIADSLRVYSEEFRDKRMQRAEEMAAKISTKMVFPMVTCLWPGFFIIAVGPAILQVMAAFGK